jgi:hypothetical protein
MANIVSTEFVGLPANLFRAADLVEARLTRLQARFTATSAFSPTATASQSLLQQERSAATSLLATRQANERAFTSAYIAQIKVREAAEAASLRRILALRNTSIGSTTAAAASGAASDAAVRGAGVGAAGAGGLALGLGGALGAGVGIATALAIKESIPAYEIIQKKQREFRTTTAAVSKDLADFFALRGIETAKIPDALDRINAGIADTELFGKNAIVILDIYAARLGRTADSLTQTERAQALLTEALRQSDLGLGDAASRMTTLEKNTDRVKKQAKELLETLGGFTVPAISNILSFISEAAGGTPAPSTAAEQDRELRENLDRQKAILRDYQQLQKDYAEAQRNPLGNLLSFSLSRFANRDQLFGGTPEDRERAKSQALEFGKEYVESFSKGIRANIGLSTVPELRQMASQVFDMRNLMPFEEWRSLSQDVQKAITDAVDAGKKKADELGRSWRDAFAGITAQANRENPFVQIFTDSQKAIDDLREKLKGLPLEMQAAALASQRAANSAQLFGARADNALGSLDLRDLISDFNRTSNSTNPDVIKNILARARLADSFGDTPEKKLDRQIAALNRLDPSNSAERAIVDQRILRLAGNLDPNVLRNDQRELIAQTAERQAEREERRFQEALTVQKEQLATQKALLSVQERLTRSAEREGLRGVESALQVTIRNESDAEVRARDTPQRASARATQILYEEQFR